jgi:hypothetical protein
MKNILLTLIVFGIVGCATVTYDSQILEPNASQQTNSYIGFGPFRELLETYSINSEHVFVDPVIPLNHLETFQKCYGPIPSDEKKLAFVNATIAFTVNGHGCEGGLFTNKGLHLNAGSLAGVVGKAFIPYQTLYRGSTTFEPSLGVTINDGATLDLHVDDDERKMTSVFLTARARSKVAKYQNQQEIKQTLKINSLPSDVLKFFNDYPNQYYYAAPNIPEKKELTFRKCSFMKSSEKLYVLFDNTFFGTGSCIGAGFTDSGVYFTNPGEANFPGTFFLSYDQILLSDFTPYIGKRFDEVFIYPGLSYYVFEDTPKNFLSMLKGLRGEEMISNDDAMKFVSNYKAIPSYKSYENTQIQPKKVSKPKPQKKKESTGGSSWGNVGWALLGLVVAKAIYEELDDGYSTPNYPSSKGKTSSEYGEALLQRQRKINNQRLKQKQQTELLTSLFAAKSYDWDGFYDAYGNFVYRCRVVAGSGSASGQFAENYHCADKIKDDDRWPSIY